MEQPIIVRIEKQECIGYQHMETDRPTSIIKNVGVDSDGQHWQWTTYSVGSQNQHGFFTETQIDGNDYLKV